MVQQTLAPHALAEARLVQGIHRALLEHANAHPLFNILRLRASITWASMPLWRSR
jgi:hypothetical protein